MKDDERADFNIGEFGAYVPYEPAAGYIEESGAVRGYYHQKFFTGSPVREKKQVVKRYKQNGH